MNGTTSFDRTNYFETLPASDDNLEFAISMEADRLVNSWIKQEHLDAEMTIVRSEFERGENSPQRILFQRVMDRRLPVAQLRQIDDRQQIGHHAGSGDQSAGVLPESFISRITSRWWSPASSMSKRHWA